MTAIKGIRGGCWVNLALYTRSAQRYAFDPRDAYHGFGFRLARVEKEQALAQLVLRGGSLIHKEGARCAYRLMYTPARTRFFFGFRLVKVKK